MPKKRYKQTEEHKRKRVETRRKNGNYVLTDEQKRKLSEAGKNRKQTDETKRKIGKGNNGKKRTEEMKQKQRIIRLNNPTFLKHKKECPCSFCKAQRGELSGKNNPKWVNGDYKEPHVRLLFHKGKASEYKCVGCGKQAREWSNVDHLYKRILEDYQPRCRSCHNTYDYKYNNRNRTKK